MPVTPARMRWEHLLAAAVWDEDGVRDDLRSYVLEHLSDPDDPQGRDVVLVADETGDVKKGTAMVGVGRQYTGTAGRIEVAQVAVYLVYAGPRGHAFLDRERSLPAAWADDLDRRHRAGVPAQVRFATKPALARRMVTRALDAGVGARWFAGDEVYGSDPHLRRALRAQGLGYVLTIARSPSSAPRLGSAGPSSWLSVRSWPGTGRPPAPMATAATTGP